MLLECAVGDSYGAGFEFQDLDFVAPNNTLEYLKHPVHPGLRPGMYTDDTQMSLAVAELVLGEQDWTPVKVADKFVEAFHRDQRRGYAGNFYLFLLEHKTGEAFLRDIMPMSDKSGAAMRASPLAFLPDFEDVKRKCRMQAAITHFSDDGTNAALAVAAMSWYGMRHGRDGMLAFVTQTVPGYPWAEAWQGQVGVKGIMCARAALTVVLEHDNLADMLKAAVGFTGDVDTVGAIAMSVASECPDVVNNLPKALLDKLEDGPYGKKYLMELDAKLHGN